MFGQVIEVSWTEGCKRTCGVFAQVKLCSSANRVKRDGNYTASKCHTALSQMTDEQFMERCITIR